jgi:hypothetical protein
MARFEIVIGRSLAICAHPVAAWHTQSVRYRCVLVGGYVGAGYLLTLAVLALAVA